MDHECVFEPGHYGDFAHVICENVPGDAGGLTKFGIDQASHPHIDIKALDYSQASQIYHDDEWTRCRCDDLPDGYDIAVFDIAVNNGAGAAAVLLQRAVAVTIDGFIGPKTIAAANNAGASGLATLLSLRRDRYEAIVARNPGQSKFLKGWLDRNSDLAQLVAPKQNAVVPA